RKGGAHRPIMQILACRESPAVTKLVKRYFAATSVRQRSIRRGQPPHGEFDPPVGQFAPALDLGHIGGLGEAAEHVARLLACLLAWQRKGLAAKAVIPGLPQRPRSAGGKIGGRGSGTH